jgi:hypothetical protein
MGRTLKAQESYLPAAINAMPRCAIPGCVNPIVAEVHIDSYAQAVYQLRGITRRKIMIRRVGDERLFICEAHLQSSDARLNGIEWQLLLI